MTTWDRCKCAREHATGRGFVRCKLRGLKWVTGQGDYALVAWCGAPTVTLWSTLPEALDAHNLLHAIRCGRDCRNRHEVIQLATRKATA